MTRHLLSDSVHTTRATLRAAALGASSALIWAAAGIAQAEDRQRSFEIEAQPLGDALLDYARQSDRVVTVPPALVDGRMAEALSGEMAPDEALHRLLADTGLSTERSSSGAYRVRAVNDGEAGHDDDPVDADAADEPEPQEAALAIDNITVTAQRREQRIQDVPIAVSAFSAQALNDRKIEGGSELLRAIPNVTFSKNNFSMYNFSIRGVGTKAISAASDPGVAISFNNTPLIRNRLFEQEYLDVQRVEVLRGPQGTLYGRNATGGVVNMIPNIAIHSDDIEGNLGVEVGNYASRRMRGFINVPVSDTFAVRLAGAATRRDGFDYNTFNDHHVNDRNLWSSRLSASWSPSDRFRANLIWEHFDEDDQRARTGKQLCTTDPGPAEIGDTSIDRIALQNMLSQGCLPETLFSTAAYGTPNAASFPAYRATSVVISLGRLRGDTEQATIVPFGGNPYEGQVQSLDLREIATSYDPLFRAENDVAQLNFEFDLSDRLRLFSQTAYAKDDYWSTQDYARFISNDIFLDTSLLERQSPIAPGGVYHDPQLGPSTRLEAADLNQSDNQQWYQEFRLQSRLEGNFNFLLGANYLYFETQDDYYVFNNLFSMASEYIYNQWLAGAGPKPSPYENTSVISDECDNDYNGGNPTFSECVYIDRSPISNLAGDGHNYFRSKNVIETRSWAVFGEGYWDLRPDLRVTLGLRHTEDQKTSTPYPTQLLLGANLDGSTGISSGGFLRRGFFADPKVKQDWKALTGRLVVDWRPQLSFTDDTLLYASYSRGYKGGGTNPPRAAINPDTVQYLPLEGTFDPEYLNAFEIGAKNAFAGGRATLNATAFYYDYKDYQVSQIVDRTSLNENFDATVWGLELEGVVRPTPQLQIDGNLGYLNTRIASGEGSIDVMDRTAGDEDWTVVRPWVQVPSNCIAPTEHVETVIQGSPTYGDFLTTLALSALCSGSRNWGTFNPEVQSNLRFDQFYGFVYNPLADAPNNGRGIETDLSGHELPNAPSWTANLGTQYTFHQGEWELTPRADYYWQDESYFRVFNSEYDRLKSWDNLNVSFTMVRPRDRLVVELYVKNVLDDTPIVDAFTNSDDTQLTTNVFTLDPRLWGLRISKDF
ncbi:TonB-dependent receptor [Flagellatimonas centrodinii]|uniref:TonB-dependent receptor domain-containing protein n=1 Tax=Flagellatimonas centrodinii TaxID=2806210 RepID=UPI001FEDA353|nr:TonB-dependent receptor [Flagellatimonas centrodinii]ULQ46658.1 TonB-dependent receptor [Flagellatimonas centrodinii]